MKWRSGKYTELYLHKVYVIVTPAVSDSPWSRLLVTLYVCSWSTRILAPPNNPNTRTQIFSDIRIRFKNLYTNRARLDTPCNKLLATLYVCSCSTCVLATTRAEGRPEEADVLRLQRSWKIGYALGMLGWKICFFIPWALLLVAAWNEEKWRTSHLFIQLALWTLWWECSQNE